MDGQPNCSNKTAFSHFSTVMKAGLNFKCRGIEHLSIDAGRISKGHSS